MLERIFGCSVKAIAGKFLKLVVDFICYQVWNQFVKH
jgi:hypothetical protein